MRTQYRILFWSLVYLVLLITFGTAAGNYIHSFYFVSFFFPVVFATSWFFYEILVIKYLIGKKYFRFFLYTFYLIIISINLEMIIVFIALTLLSYYEPDNMRSILTDFRLMPVVMYLIVFISAFVSVISQLLIENERKRIPGDSPVMYIEIRSERKNRRVLLDSIIYIESMADYVIIFTLDSEKIITRQRISYFERFLPGNFLRIHRSYIVNTDHLRSYNREEVTVPGASLPVSRTYKDEVSERLSSK